MRTTLPLSGDDRRMLQAIIRKSKRTSTALFVVAGFISIPVIFFLTAGGGWISLLFLAIGLLFMITGISKQQHSGMLAKQVALLHEKEAFTGSLLKVDYLGNNKLRYQFSGFFVDVIPHLDMSQNFRISSIRTLTNYEVTLHVVTLTENDVFVFKVFYGPQETVTTPSTMIAEKLDISTGSGKYSRDHTWYRLANGEIRNLRRSDLLLGEPVKISYVDGKNGRITVNRIKA